jgi:23S rRNA (cytosine1962-C5)-methyltransferase
MDPGGWVEVFSSKRVLLGAGYVNPHSLIAVRLVCPPGQKPTREFFATLLQAAAARRRFLYPDSQCNRIVYGESDGLPGLVVDRYGDILSYQITTLGMARMEPLIQDLLRELFTPAALVYRNDVSLRTLEGLGLEKGVVFGEAPERHWVTIDSLQFGADLLNGHKTGLYLDQRDNRLMLQRLSRGKRVLDLFCYNGGWGIAAAAAGATEVVGVDQSATAIANARANAARNRLDGVCAYTDAEVFKYLKTVEKGRFDIIVLDPPAFAKNKNALTEAHRGYTDLNRRALLALNPGGILITSSCSYHMHEELFQDMLLKAAQASGKQLRLIEARGQSMDHPPLLAMPETRYLKCYLLEVL